MRRLILLTVLLYSSALAASCAAPAPESSGSSDAVLDELVALERSALDRWIRLDPEGYLGLYAPDITYFDPTTAKRVESVDAMRTRLAPMKDLKLPVTNPRYEMIAPKVQRHGDTALLTFNLVNYGVPPDGAERVLARWNSTEVYSRVGGRWKIVHSHWSYVRPEIKQSGS